MSSTFLGSGWVPLRRVNVADGSYDELTTVAQDTMLAANADRTVVAYAQSNNWGGPFGRYAVSGGAFLEGTLNWYLYEVAVNWDASQYALPNYGGLAIHDASLQQIAWLGSTASRSALGAVYSPLANVLYVAWSSFNDSGAIEAVDSSSFTSLATLDAKPGLSWGGNHAFSSGRLRVSRDGRGLLATVAGGVRLYALPEP